MNETPWRSSRQSNFPWGSLLTLGVLVILGGVVIGYRYYQKNKITVSPAPSQSASPENNIPNVPVALLNPTAVKTPTPTTSPTQEAKPKTTNTTKQKSSAKTTTPVCGTGCVKPTPQPSPVNTTQIQIGPVSVSSTVQPSKITKQVSIYGYQNWLDINTETSSQKSFSSVYIRIP